MTFSWVYPLIKLGTATTLHEKDVWELSPTFQSRPVFIQFGRTPRRTFLHQVWAANSLDIILDFSFTYVSVILSYAGPFFLKRILDAIDTDATPEDRAKAYIYAGLAFVCQLLEAQSDLQHLWFERRAAARVRSQLTAAIYDKALKRKDFSGIVDAAKTNEAKEQKQTEEKKGSTRDDPKAGANTGKIINLMSGDTDIVCLCTLTVSLC